MILRRSETVLFAALLLFILLFSTGCINFNDYSDNINYDKNITIYYGTNCPHCAKTTSVLTGLRNEYEYNLILKEIYFNPANYNEMRLLQNQYNVPKTIKGGVPVIMVNDMMIIGEMPREKWDLVLTNCIKKDICIKSYFWYSTITPELFENVTTQPEKNVSHAEGSLTFTVDGQQEDNKLTWSTVIVGAMVDSINPCTIAVLALLLTTIFLQKNNKKVIIAGLLFVFIIYIMYFIMGLGFMQVIQKITEAPIMQMLFYVIMIILAGLMTVLELKSYFNYKPGMLLVEMPMFLRPYMKKVIAAATSYPMVAVAAVICSLFLLPCSAGPYVTILTLLAQEKTVENLLYLGVYNFIFVFPMIIITLIVGAGLSTPDKVKEARNKYVKQMHLIAGVLMALLVLLLIYHLLGLIGLI